MSQTNKLPKIQVSTVGGTRSYIPLTHDVYATHRVGKITPYMCRFFDAQSKMKVDLETLEYNAPMVSPTVGDIKFKHWTYFVGLDKLCPTFAELLAKNPTVLSNLEEYVQQYVPQISWRYLSMLALIGSFCTVYYTVDYKNQSDPSHPIYPFGYSSNGVTLFKVGDINNQGNSANYELIKNAVNFASSNYISFEGEIGRNLGIFNTGTNPITGLPGISVSVDMLNLGYNSSFITNDACIPLSNPSYSSLFDWEYNGKKVYSDPTYSRETHGLDCSPVPYEHPDVRISKSFTEMTYTEEGNNGKSVDVTVTLHYCFRLSDFGRAIRDIIIASGLELNFISNKNVSLLPYFATYLAYFESQSLQMYKNWKMTHAYKVLWDYMITDASDLTSAFLEQAYDNHFIRFIADELGEMWAIQPHDFTSAHMRDPQMAPLVFNSLDAFSAAVNDSQQSVNISLENQRDEFGLGLDNTTPFINAIKHDLTSAELIKRLTLRMNVNTLEGYKTKKSLEINGFGDWIDLQTAHFIDYGEMRIDMKPVVSQSDTSTEEGKGADLGQYGGRGSGRGSHRGKTYVNSVPGYLVMLTTIYVDAGYCQAVDPYNFQTNVDDFYRRDFDSIGFELSSRDLIHGSAVYVQSGEVGETDKPFGYVPRDMKYKQMSNRLLGNFTTGELSDVYDTYHIEKLMPIGYQPVVKTQSVDTTYDEHNPEAGYTFFTLGARYGYKDFATCGNIWRFLGRYPWLGRYERIFKLMPQDLQRVNGIYALEGFGENLPEIMAKFYTYFTLSPENYTLLNTVYLDTWQDKIPISRSFGTLSDVFDGHADKSIAKE